jgi:NAD(P)-dependent dehydrogenase (short-subunit alcohol dehydrogenase family)
MSQRMNGARAVVTGATRGIGRAIALRFAAEGASIALAGRDRLAAEDVAAELRAAGRSASIALGDVADPDDARAVVEAAVDGLGGLDVLVNNAGVDARDWKPVHEWAVADFDRILAVNLRGPFLMSKWAIPHLLDAGGGAILHVSSVCATTVWAGDCAYDISKAGLNMLSDHIAVEYGKQNIRSNTLMPGCVRTELHEYVMGSMNDGRAFERELLRRHPIGRFGTPEEIAEAAVLLCCGEAGFMTGANVHIDGAYSRV